jgi:hypothetical protein
MIDIGDQFIINQIVYTVVGKSETTCQVVSGTATSDDRISMPIGVVAEHIKSYLE